MAGPLLEALVTLRSKSKSKGSYLEILLLIQQMWQITILLYHIKMDQKRLQICLLKVKILNYLLKLQLKWQNLFSRINSFPFKFGGRIKVKVSGRATGTKFAPAYAQKPNILKRKNCSRLYGFNIFHGIFFIWTHSEHELNKFLENLKNFKSNLKFTFEISKDDINLPDLTVSNRESNLVTELYFKAKDCHQYLHYQSSHP